MDKQERIKELKAEIEKLEEELKEESYNGYGIRDTKWAMREELELMDQKLIGPSNYVFNDRSKRENVLISDKIHNFLRAQPGARPFVPNERNYYFLQPDGALNIFIEWDSHYAPAGAVFFEIKEHAEKAREALKENYTEEEIRIYFMGARYE